MNITQGAGRPSPPNPQTKICTPGCTIQPEDYYNIYTPGPCPSCADPTLWDGTRSDPDRAEISQHLILQRRHFFAYITATQARNFAVATAMHASSSSSSSSSNDDGSGAGSFAEAACRAHATAVRARENAAGVPALAQTFWVGRQHQALPSGLLDPSMLLFAHAEGRAVPTSLHPAGAEDEEPVCAICIEEIGTPPSPTFGSHSTTAAAVATQSMTTVISSCAVPCGHVFHSFCLRKWWAQSMTCPLCKGTFKVEVLPSFEETIWSVLG
ncbi:MAG: hypothetical protein M1818_002626 [Claussenomyces sp. TS43310]|nr:MAG: hypothetical protein M1818_002626 [Claussenomyces sp. TS43310]